MCLQARPGFRFGSLLAVWLTWICVCAGQSVLPRQVRGTVEDSSHATLPNAIVTLKQGLSEFHQTTATDGTFAFSNLSADKLEITISATGFASTRRLIPSLTHDLDLVIALEPERVSTEIEVTASRTALSLDEAPQSVQIVSSADFRSSGALELDDVLRQVAGFDQFRRNSSRTSNPTTQVVS